MEQKKWVAGREMDVLVERHIFQKEFFPYSGWHHTDMLGVIASPKYSTDIVAAWQVIDHMQKDLEWQFIIEAHSGEWSVLITPHVSSVDYGRIEYEGWADTIQLAICLAALRAVGGFRSRGCEMQCNHELKSNGIRGGMTYFCIGDKSHSGEHTYWINGKEKKVGDAAERIADLERENARLEEILLDARTAFDEFSKSKWEFTTGNGILAYQRLASALYLSEGKETA